MKYEEENAIDLETVLGNEAYYQIGGIDYTVYSYFSHRGNEDILNQFMHLLLEKFAHSQQ